MAFNWGSLGGGLGSLFGGAAQTATQQSGTPGYTGYDVIQAQTTPAYDYSARGLENLSTGQMPQYWQKARPKIRRGMIEGQQQAYYGTPGDRYGAYQTGIETGALTGLGAGATQKSLRPLNQKYMDESRKIDEYLASQDVSVYQNAEKNYLGTMGGYRPSQIAPYAIQGTNPPDNQVGSAVSQLPWGDMLSGVMGMFGKNGTTGTTTDYLSGIGQYQGLTYPSQGNYNWAQTGNSTSSGSNLTDYFNQNYSGYQF